MWSLVAQAKEDIERYKSECEERGVEPTKLKKEKEPKEKKEKKVRCGWNVPLHGWRPDTVGGPTRLVALGMD